MIQATKNKRLIIDESLFIEPPISVEISKTPVCDYVYREKSGAYFFIGLTQNQRKILWDFLRPARYNLQVWGTEPGFMNSQLRDLSVECQFLLFLMILRRNKTIDECWHSFGISNTIISKVFKTCLSFCHSEF